MEVHRIDHTENGEAFGFKGHIRLFFIRFLFFGLDIGIENFRFSAFRNVNHIQLLFFPVQNFLFNQRNIFGSKAHLCGTVRFHFGDSVLCGKKGNIKQEQLLRRGDPCLIHNLGKAGFIFLTAFFDRFHRHRDRHIFFVKGIRIFKAHLNPGIPGEFFKLQRL